MKLLRSALLFAALAALSSSARAHEEFFFANLTGSGATPPNGSPGVGTALITFDLDLVTMRIEIQFSGLTSNTTAANVHAATALAGTGTAGIATAPPSLSGFPLGVTNGTYDQTFDMTVAGSYNPAFLTISGGTVSDGLNALIFALEQNKAYLNIETASFPGGEITGFFAPVAAPEPGTLALALLGGAGLLVRRRKVS
jgi:hypothetical protein